jgi:hypothetical protein
MGNWEYDRAMELEDEEAERQARLRQAAEDRRQAEIAARKAEQAKLDATPLLDIEKELATQLHGLMCSWNHTDGCSWFYAKETDEDWNRNYGRVEYIKKARFIIAQGANPEEVIKTVQLIQSSKHAK